MKTKKTNWDSLDYGTELTNVHNGNEWVVDNYDHKTVTLKMPYLVSNLQPYTMDVTWENLEKYFDWKNKF
tara:strand:+ start:99 stop:308 length:210 start_codon:yes stop_codon:yes gene_type:complete